MELKVYLFLSLIKVLGLSNVLQYSKISTLCYQNYLSKKELLVTDNTLS